MKRILTPEQVLKRRQLYRQLDTVGRDSPQARSIFRQIFQLESNDGCQVVDLADLIEANNYEAYLEKHGLEKTRRLVQRNHTTLLADQILEELREEELV